MLMTGVLTAVAFYGGWARVSDHERLHQRFLMERRELLTVVQAAAAEKDPPKDADNSNPSGMRFQSSKPSVDLDQLLDRPLSKLDRQEFERHWSSGKSPNGMAYLSSNFKAWRPPTVLGAISVGESDQWPEFYTPKMLFGGKFPTSSEAQTLSASRIVNPYHVSVGAFEMSTLLIVILPLVSIALTYDVLSQDRELGILRLLGAQNVSIRMLVMIRLALRPLSVVGVLLCVLLLGYVIVGADLFNGSTWALLGTFTLTVLVYTGFWAAVAWFVNSLGFSSMTNAVLLAMCWIVVVFVVPVSIAQSVAGAHPVPASGALASKEKEIQKSIQEMQTQMRLEAREMHGEQLREAQAAFWQETAAKGALELRERMTVEIDRYYREHDERDAAMLRWQFLSPALAVKQACDLIAGNSHAQFVQFTRDVCSDHSEYLDYFRTLSGKNERLTSAEIEKAPTFARSGSTARVDWQALWWSIGVVAAWALLLGVLGWTILPARLQTV